MKVEEPAEPSTSETEGSKTGMSLQEAFDKYGFKLSSFETREIFRFILWERRATKINGGIDLRDTSRFDDEYGFYRFVPEDHLAYRYELVKPLGKGTTAQVFSAVDHKENRSVAIKVMKSQPRYHRQAKSEIEMLERLNNLNKDGNIDVVQMYDHFCFRNHACIVFELLSENLWSVIKETKKQGLPLHRVQGFACSLIKVLDALGRNKIMHGDLKLDNILVKQTGKSDIKLIDFGMAEYDQEDETALIQALHYRAPEVILGAKYGRQVDMWSFGVILTELFTGKTVPEGSDESDQLALGMEVFGVPPPEFLELCSRAKNFIKDGEPCFADVRSSANMRAPPGCRELSSVLKNCEDVHFLGFIRGCLTWDPRARLTPSQALVHPFITNKIPRPDDNEKSAFSPAAEDSQPDSAVSRGTYKERRVTNKRKRSELED
ncbi:Dual specificity tyrosine-phosphorylation-regulated kinase 2 [Orchesella cincta]|uniref:Dual specificity tyrosine-phosphorylation-regulated kinase 2 n=1 Tax=Orchesella cincta TaxID=48709 RepID=A0A1D2M3F4_ORCCI|nr:Dual specificity tyrosine-phosphorylation-regulated kinase 2 [Orchesella cincta]